MATQKTTPKTSKTPLSTPVKKPSVKAEPAKFDFAFGRENYIIMLVGLVVLFIGYLIMIGGSPDDPTAYSDQIFNTRRLVIAPLTLLIGLIIEIYAIMRKPKDNE